MSLLVPDYASSSEDEVHPSLPLPTPPSATALHATPSNNTQSISRSTASDATKPKQKKTKKRKKTKMPLYLPPIIRQLLETGTVDGSFSDDSDIGTDNGLLAKHKHVKKASSKRPRPIAGDKGSVLSFLPPPQHKLPASDAAKSNEAAIVDKIKQATTQEATAVEVDQQPINEVAAATNPASWQQDYHQPQQCPASNAPDFNNYYMAQGEEDATQSSSKCRRMRERAIERALQQGHFETVADQITDVRGPAPHAWQPPENVAGGTSSQDVKVKASFWNAQAGMKVSSMKPTRMQRQKHQLNQLAFDAKARDFELLEKRGAALKTKSETYAKYGW